MPQSTRRTSDVPIFHALPPELVPRSRVSIETAETQWRDLLGACSRVGARMSSAELAAKLSGVIADMQVAVSPADAPAA